MPENQPDSTATTVAFPPQKTTREKTMEASQVNNLTRVDVTQQLSQAEIAVIARSNEEASQADTATASTSVAPTTEPTTVIEPKPTNTTEKKAEETKKQTGYIESIVGNYTSNDKEKANLAKDVILVQEHLVRLEILSDVDFATEKPAGTGEVSKDKIPKTIGAIQEFQDKVLGYTPDGFCRPAKGTIKNLVNLKSEDKAAKMAEVQKKKEAKTAEEAKKKTEEEKQKALAYQEAKAKAEAEKKKNNAKIKKAARIIEVQYTDPSYLNVFKLTWFMSFSELGEFLKDYALYNPRFVRKAYHIYTGYTNSDNLTVDILSNMSDSEIAQIPYELNEFFYETMDNGWTTKEEEALMARLKTGKAKTEGKNSQKDEKKRFKTVGPIISTDDYRSQSPNAIKGVKDSEPSWTNCKLVAEKMVYRHLYENLDDDFKQSDVTNDKTGKYEYIVGNVSNNEYLSILHEDKSEYKNIKEGKHKQSRFIDADTKDKALDYIDEYLEQGIAVVVGVDHTFNRSLSKKHKKTTSKHTRGYNEGTTDHFIVVIGKGVTEDGKKYYQYYDPGTSHKSVGTNTDNKLIENEKGHFTSPQPYNKKRTYHLTMVILFKKDLSKHSEEVKSNKKYESQLNDSFKNETGDFKK